MIKAKTVYLVRHAKSSWSDPTLSDQERPLNKRGTRNVPVMSQRLADHIAQLDGQFPSPEYIISSPAIRAMHTAQGIAQALGLSGEYVHSHDKMYFCGAKAMLDILLTLNDQTQSLMLVGHNPDISSLHNLLNPLAVDKMPTCAIATIRFETENWQDILRRGGSLVDFDYPKKCFATVANTP